MTSYMEAAKRIRIHLKIMKSQEMRTVSITDALEVALIALSKMEETGPCKPMTLEELLQMDGLPVYVQCGDGERGWAIAAIDGDSVCLYGPEIAENNFPENDFYDLKHDDPDGHYGLHVLGWRAWRSEQSENAEQARAEQ